MQKLWAICPINGRIFEAPHEHALPVPHMARADALRLGSIYLPHLATQPLARDAPHRIMRRNAVVFRARQKTPAAQIHSGPQQEFQVRTIREMDRKTRFRHPVRTPRIDRRR